MLDSCLFWSSMLQNFLILNLYSLLLYLLVCSFHSLCWQFLLIFSFIIFRSMTTLSTWSSVWNIHHHKDSASILSSLLQSQACLRYLISLFTDVTVLYISWVCRLMHEPKSKLLHIHGFMRFYFSYIIFNNLIALCPENLWEYFLFCHDFFIHVFISEQYILTHVLYGKSLGSVA